MNGIRDLLEGLEDAYALRLRRREARTAVARCLKSARMTAGVRSLRRGGTAPLLDSVGEAEARALAEAERACAALEARWEALERAVSGGEEALGLAPPAPDPAILAEIDLLVTDGSFLSGGFAPGRRLPDPPSAGQATGRAAVAVGTGLLVAALGAPHMAFHAAMAAGHAASPKKAVRRPHALGLASQAMDRLRRGIPAGTPSADEVLLSLDGLSRAPRDRAAWEAFVDAAEERVGVLRRAHLRVRAAALFERQEP